MPEAVKVACGYKRNEGELLSVYERRDCSALVRNAVLNRKNRNDIAIHFANWELILNPLQNTAQYDKMSDALKATMLEIMCELTEKAENSDYDDYSDYN